MPNYTYLSYIMIGETQSQKIFMEPEPGTYNFWVSII